MCSFPQEIGCHKTFRPISSGNRPPQNFFGSFPQEIGRHKLFRPISSGNRPPQNFFGSFPQEIGRHKLFRLISSGNRPPQNCFGSFPQEIGHSLAHSFPQEIGHSLTHSFPQEIAGWASTHFLRKSLDGLHRTGRYSYILTSNSRFRRCTWKGAFLMRSPCSSSPNRLKNTVLVRFFLHLAIRSRSDRFSIVK